MDGTIEIADENFSWRVLNIDELSARRAQEITELVVAANRVRPRIFPRDRLQAGDLQKEYRGARVILASLEPTLCGCMVTQVKVNVLWLSLLAVSPEWQGIGLGSAIIDVAENMAANQGLDRLGLDVVDVGSLVTYYLGLAFTEESRWTAPTGQWGSTCPFDLVKMVRPVGLNSVG